MTVAHLVETVLWCQVRAGGAIYHPGQIAGRAGGKLKAGRVVSYDDKPDRRLCRLLMLVADNMGVRLPEFGDADERFEEFC
mgnify:CR=1 FL=1